MFPLVEEEMTIQGLENKNQQPMGSNYIIAE